MKRNLLAIAIPALLLAGAANASIEIYNKDGNKLEVNGRVHAFNYIGKAAENGNNVGDHTDARLGFTGETQISDSVIGYGRAEWQTGAGSNNGTENRYAFAGFKFGYLGQIDYGRNDGISKSVTNYTDVFPEFGGDATNYVVLGQRTNGVVTYRNTDFFGLVDGLSIAAQYATRGDNKNPAAGFYNNETDKTTHVAENTGDAYGVNVDYAILDTGLSLGAAYAESKGPVNYRSYLGGAKYDANNLYLGAIYTHTEDANSDYALNGFEVITKYGFDFEAGRVTPSIGYIQHKEKKAGVSTSNDKYIDLGLTYDFNKNISAIVDYKINLLKEEENSKNYGDTVAVGLIYQF